MKLIAVASTVILAAVAIAQFMLHTGPTSVSPINCKLDGSVKHVWSNDGIGAKLWWDDGSADVFFGVDATFRIPTGDSETFWLVLYSASKSDEPSFDRFEVFDFTVREWIEVGGTLEGSTSGSTETTFMSSELKCSRFAHPKSGEVWARSLFNAKLSHVVWIDQFAVLTPR